MRKHSLEDAYIRRSAEVNNILRKYLSDDGIWLAAYEGESDWLKFDIAKKGEKYIKNSNKEYKKRYEREKERTYNDSNLRLLAKAIRRCQEKYENRYESMIPLGWQGDGLSDDIRYALFLISQFE